MTKNSSIYENSRIFEVQLLTHDKHTYYEKAIDGNRCCAHNGRLLRH